MRRTLCLLLFVLVGTASLVQAESKSAGAFEKLKSLVGKWQGKLEDGSTAKLSYELTSGGSVLVETMAPSKEHTMVTMYHQNGDNLMATHYCAAGNQPRMQASPGTGELKKLDFKFVDATNLAKTSPSFMKNLVVTFEDNNHFTQQWTWSQDGKETSSLFKFERKK